MTLLSALAFWGADSKVGARMPLLAFSGGGGKTTALFALAEELAAAGARVLATTTTRIRDPRAEGRSLDAFLNLQDLSAELNPVGGSASSAGLSGGRPLPRGSITVLGAGVEKDKLVGVDPAVFPSLAASGRWDVILAEADGAKGRPIKAPAPREPVWPELTTIAVGVVGLDALGAPLDERTAHRPELLGPLVGLKPGEGMDERAVLRLVRHPEGLFRGAPDSARRVLVLNKADIAPNLDPWGMARYFAEALAPGSPFGASDGAGRGAPCAAPYPSVRVDFVLVCAMARGDPDARVLAFRAVL